MQQLVISLSQIGDESCTCKTSYHHVAGGTSQLSIGHLTSPAEMVWFAICGNRTMWETSEFGLAKFDKHLVSHLVFPGPRHHGKDVDSFGAFEYPDEAESWVTWLRATYLTRGWWIVAVSFSILNPLNPSFDHSW